MICIRYVTIGSLPTKILWLYFSATDNDCSKRKYDYYDNAARDYDNYHLDSLCTESWNYNTCELSVVKLTEQRHSACNPVPFRLIAWNLHCSDEVGGVTGRRENASSFTRLIHRRRVCLLLGQIRTTTWLYPDLCIYRYI